MDSTQVIQLIQVSTPLAEELIKDIISLFHKHAPAASVTDVASVATSISVIANKGSVKQ